MFSLAKRYAKGDGVERDEGEARAWFAAAANKGLPDAMLELGCLLVDGRGGPQALGEGVAWWEKAAEAGSKEAAARVADLEAHLEASMERRRARHARGTGASPWNGSRHGSTSGSAVHGLRTPPPPPSRSGSSLHGGGITSRATCL